LTVDTDVKTVNVTDTTNEVKVTLVAPSDVTEGTDTVTFTVKVESGIALTEPLVVTLSDNQTVTIPAGQTEATVTVNVGNAEDVYKDPSDVKLSITKAETAGKEFEKLTVDTDVKTVNVTDTENEVKVTLVAPEDVTEGTDTVTFTVKVESGIALTEPLVVTLSDNQTVTIPAGQTEATVTVNVGNAEDVYKDPSDVKLSITKAEDSEGREFEKLTVDTAEKTAKVTDTTNEVKVNLTASIVNENGSDTSYVFTATLEKPSQGKTTIVTDKGTIEILDGQTTGTLTITSNQTEDVYLDASELTATITSATGGNFESLVVGNASATAKVTDTTNEVKVNLTASTVNENGSDTSYVFTATLEKPSQGKTTIVTDKGTIEILDGQTTGTLKIASNQTGDVYLDASELTATITSATGGNFENLVVGNASATAKVTDTITPIDVTITATVTTPKIIDVNTKTDGTTGVKVTGYNSDGIETKLSVIKGTKHDGFGVAGKNLSNGDTRELGVGEKIVVEFTNGKDVNSLDVSFAWRHNGETAKLTFIKDDKVVGFATVDGDGKSTTKAIVKYFDATSNEPIKEVNAKGSSDKVDEAFTFELPDSNGGLVSFDKVEFSAPKIKDDYLIHEIKYKEVLNTEVTDIVTNGGNVTFNIQIDEKYPPQGKATANVEINGKTYNVELNATGRGTLTIDSKELGDLSKVEAKVIEVIGGKYEKVNEKEEKFDFTQTVNTPTSKDDTISTDEDVAYTLKVTDFGEVSSNTKEFKITELPTPEIGKLFLNITKGETIFNPDGTKTEATQDSRVEITKGQIVTLGQVGAGKVEFVPKENSDVDGSFKFQVGDGNGNFSEEYTTTIDIKAVADAPTVSISITPDASNPASTGSNGNENSGSSENNGSSNIGATKPSLNISSDWWNGLTELTKNDVITGKTTYEKDVVNWGQSVTTTNGDDVISIGELNGRIDTGLGDDKIYISKELSNNGSTINAGDGNDTVLLAKDVNSNVDLGVGNDRLDIKGNLGSTINAGSGDDKIFIKGSASQNSTINLGEGNNELHVKGDVGIVNGGSVADTVLVEGSTTNTINLGDGNNELHIKGNAGNTVTTGSGNDKVFIEKDAKNSINLGDGDNLLHIKGNVEKTIDTGSGDDKVFIEKDAKNSIRLGAGNNELYIKGNAENTIDTGLGNDIVIVDGNAKNSVRLGDGNNELYIKGSAVDITTGTGADKVFVDGNISNYVNLGAGDDYLEIGGKLTANNTCLDGGDGTDSLYLKDYTKQQYESDFVANYQSWRIKNFETITFKDVDTYKIDKDGKLGDKVEAKGYKYDITVNAQLTDTDGSESLSKDENGNEIITLKNIPVGSTLYNGEVNEANKLTANPDGSYTVKVDESGEAKLSVTNEKEISDTDLNSIKASVTSIEGSNSDSATTTVSQNFRNDIDLSGLKSILKEQETGDIDLSKNGSQDKLTLTLDDVLKLSGDDKQIKITGDQFDSVTFKNTIGEDGKENAWSKTASDEGFDIYVNSGDESLKVKVEQPISDGITN
ncbi:calcium-binding protein, partial [Aliarcobacter cryaerophilus]|uniref:calcium-binding protein n=1 Tax=Aliarcobacter cryaerophilus TaxID=28198 RepID=UPI0021B3073A